MYVLEKKSKAYDILKFSVEKLNLRKNQNSPAEVKILTFPPIHVYVYVAK